MCDSSGLSPGIAMRCHCNHLAKELEARFSCLLALVAGVWLLSQVPPSLDVGRLPHAHRHRAWHSPGPSRSIMFQPPAARRPTVNLHSVANANSPSYTRGRGYR